VYPVQIAVTLALVVCAVPVYLVSRSRRDSRHTDAQAAQAAVQAAQQKQIADLVTGIQTSRVKATGDICRVLDRKRAHDQRAARAVPNADRQRREAEPDLRQPL
jgi:hypothetical protein